MDDLKHDLDLVEQEGAEIGLQSSVPIVTPLTPFCLRSRERRWWILQWPHCWGHQSETCPLCQMFLEPRLKC